MSPLGDDKDTIESSNCPDVSKESQMNEGLAVMNNKVKTENPIEQLTEVKNQEPQKHHPEAFYCPITKEIFSDPVVVPTGESYERSVMKDRGNEIVLYYNRALKSIIDDKLSLHSEQQKQQQQQQQQPQEELENAMMWGLKKVQDSARQTLDILLGDNKSVRPLSEGYFCPITFNLIHDPVIDPEGHTFERVAIRNWLKLNGSSPITRMSCREEQLYPNNAIRELIEEEKEKSEDMIHPSVRQFKLETPPEDMEWGGMGSDENPARYIFRNELDEQQQQQQQQLLWWQRLCLYLQLILFSIIFVILMPIFFVVFICLAVVTPYFLTVYFFVERCRECFEWARSVDSSNRSRTGSEESSH